MKLNNSTPSLLVKPIPQSNTELSRIMLPYITIITHYILLFIPVHHYYNRQHIAFPSPEIVVCHSQLMQQSVLLILKVQLAYSNHSKRWITEIIKLRRWYIINILISLNMFLSSNGSCTSCGNINELSLLRGDQKILTYLLQ